MRKRGLLASRPSPEAIAKVMREKLYVGTDYVTDPTVEGIDDAARVLAEMWPGPLSLV